jgi:hypothetical protein
MTFPSFSVGETLRAADMNAVGLWLVKTQTVGTGVSSVTVTDAFSADYDNYKIVYTGGAASGLVSIRTQLGASTSGYNAGLNYVVYLAPGTPLSASTNSGASWEFTGYATTNYSSLSYDLMSPFLSKYTTYLAAGWAAETAAGTASGIHLVASSYTSFTLIPNSGTLTGGTISVYGYRK